MTGRKVKIFNPWLIPQDERPSTDGMLYHPVHNLMSENFSLWKLNFQAAVHPENTVVLRVALFFFIAGYLFSCGCYVRTTSPFWPFVLGSRWRNSFRSVNIVFFLILKYELRYTQKYWLFSLERLPTRKEKNSCHFALFQLLYHGSFSFDAMATIFFLQLALPSITRVCSLSFPLGPSLPLAKPIVQKLQY